MPSKADVQVLMVPPELFSTAWQRCAVTAVRGMQAAGMDLRETLDRVAGLTLQLWVAVKDGAIIASFFTELLTGEGGRKAVNICGLAGSEPQLWASLALKQVEEFARNEGAGSVRFCGKRGWARIIPHYTVIGEAEPGVAIFERVL
jgi:hypothetical protein